MDANMGLGENASADERETAQVAMVQNLTRAYFRIVKKNLIDGTPKAIMCVLSSPLSILYLLLRQHCCG